jgi:NAD(P)-dependent dehydrogenase (short-subunit alcohol dehydrogenase family)
MTEASAPTVLQPGAAALITGGAGGIGRAVAARLGGLGLRLALVDRDAPGAERAAAEVSRESAAEVLAVPADVTDPAELERAVATAEERFGRLDLVHLNAGVTTGAHALDEVTPERWRRVLAVNLDGTFFGLRAAVPALRRSGGGAVVVTASLGGLVGQPEDPVYSATKHAVIGLVRSWAPPLAAEGITLCALCPGFVETPLIGEFVGAFREAGFPLLRPGDVADALVTAVEAGEPGSAWIIQPGRAAEPYRFRGVPGPQVAGHEGQRPPSVP